MIFTRIIYITTLCVLGALSQDNDDVKNKQGSKPITKASKVSEFFIADLLRTADKDQLETASTMNKPIATTPEYVHAGLLTEIPNESRRIPNYHLRTHDYSEEETSPHTESSRNFHHDVPPTRGNSGPVNVYEKFLIKQAGVLERNVLSTEGTQPFSERFSHSVDHPHHKKDCKKHPHAVASSEERYDHSYHPEETAHSHTDDDDYRNAPSTYHQNYEHDDGPSHGSYTSSYPSRSKSYASNHDSNSKSQSGESYTRTKSTSTSKTVEPAEKRGKVHVFSSTGNGYKREPVREPQADGAVVYKVKENQNRPHPDGRPIRSQDGESPVRQYYDEYPPQAPKKSSRRRPSTHQRPEYDDRSIQYDSPQGPYGASKRPYAEYDSRETYTPQSYQGPESAPLSDSRGREHHYGSSAESFTAPLSSKSGRKHRHQSSHSAREGDMHSPRKFSHAPKQNDPSYRQERRQPQYSGYATEGPRERNSPEYERSPSPVRFPDVKHSYSYDRTPTGKDEKYQSEKPPTRETRASALYTKPQSRNVDSIDGPALLPLIIKESNPHQSRSVSYSESTYNMDGPVRSKSVSIKPPVVQPRTQEEPRKMANPFYEETRDLKARGQSFQSSYKPYNSEYPATYMGDHYHPESHSHEESSEESHRPYEHEEEAYDKSPSQKGHTQTKSDITGYKDSYASHEPLAIDDHFFEKYGISKKAKVIVATAMEPNLFVADGTRLKHGQSDVVPDGSEKYTDEESYEREPASEEQTYERRPIRQEDSSYRGKSRGFRPQDLPGSFTELVGANTDYQRSGSSDGQKDSDELPGYDPSLDELVFRSGVGDPKKVVTSAGARAIVQHHGDGVSKIIFNQAAASENKEQFEAKDGGEKLQAAKSEAVEVRVKEDEKVPVSSTKSS